MLTRMRSIALVFALVALVGCSSAGLVAFDDPDPGLPRARDAATDTHDDCPPATPIDVPDVVILCPGLPEGLRCCGLVDDGGVTYAVRVECLDSETWVR